MGRRHRKKRKRKQLEKENEMVIRVADPEKKTEESIDDIDINDVKPEDISIDSIVSNDDNMEFESKVSVEMERSVYSKMMAYTQLTDEEIAGIGYVERIGKSSFKITEIFLPKQVVSKARCECDIDDQCRIMQELIDEGKDPGKLKLWWHSHNTMGTFWSCQDEKTGFISACDYFISIVVNHKKELRCKLNVFEPIEFAIDNVPVTLISDIPDEKIIEDCKNEIKERVSTQTSIVIDVKKERGNNFNRYDLYDSYGGYYNSRYLHGDPYDGMDVQDIKDPEDVDGKELNDCLLESPYGDDFSWSGYTFKWNMQKQEYDVIDSSGYILSEDEVLALGNDIYEFARPLNFENYGEDITK